MGLKGVRNGALQKWLKHQKALSSVSRAPPACHFCSVTYCHIADYPKTQWLNTIIIIIIAHTFVEWSQLASSHSEPPATAVKWWLGLE